MAGSQQEVIYPLPRTGSEGCWTGLVADMQLLKSLGQKTVPDYYLEQYPRHRASSLNTWLARFGMYSNGMFFELDRHGSNLVKDLIKRSKSERGYVVRVSGTRKGNKIKVRSAMEVVPNGASKNADISDAPPKWLRNQFATMGI